MKKEMLYAVIGVVGLAAGVVAGYMVNKPKLNKSLEDLAAAQTKVQETEKATQEKLQMAAADTARAKTEVNRINAELTRYKAEYVRANTELAKATTELNNLKASILPQSQVLDGAASGGAAVTAAGDSSGSATGAAPTASRPVVAAAGEYVIKDGDNLWNIAAEQLGKGIRYKEILAVNPGLTEKKELVVGSKIKLPAK